MSDHFTTLRSKGLKALCSVTFSEEPASEINYNLATDLSQGPVEADFIYS